MHREISCARGKLSLCDALNNGDIELSQKLINAARECLTCGACKANCSNDVDIPSIILDLRAEAARSKGVPLLHRIIGRALPSCPSIVLKAALAIQSALFAKIPEESGLHVRFSLPFIEKERLLPSLAERTFIEKYGIKTKDGIKGTEEDNRGIPKSRKKKPLRVGFFSGCLVNYMMPGIGESALRLMEKAGAEVVVPKEQVCCGMPYLSLGDRKTARKNAVKNLDAFGGLDLDFIVTPCATCATALKSHFKELLSDADEGLKKRVRDLSSKSREITELLINELGVKGKTKKVPLNVTYHDPCHLGRYQGIKDEPRELIDRAGHKFVEMGHPCRCCGLGGTFSLDHYDISKYIGRDKALDIIDTGADIVATACPGCIMQIKDALHQLGSEGGKKVLPGVVHVVELFKDA